MHLAKLKNFVLLLLSYVVKKLENIDNDNLCRPKIV